MSGSNEFQSESPVGVWQPMLFGAMAGGLAWGIRGQYGHETGAMIAGLLVSLVMVLLLAPALPTLSAARAVAWCTVAMGFGGTMTYGQTIGLTQDRALIGNWDALRWGMLGLAIKGGLWIAFAGTFLGVGLGGIRYRVRELLTVMLGLLACYALGVWLLNTPYEPAERLLPRIYFSADWRWLPDAALKPRREVWGGMLTALAGLWLYCGAWRRDGLALRLGLCGLLGGMLGFPLGQSLQAYHAWNVEWFRSGPWAQLDPHLNWWNIMETTFGAVMGGTLGLGAWLNRQRIASVSMAPAVNLSPTVEAALLTHHVALLVGAEFSNIPWLEAYAEIGLLLGLIPIAAVAGGRWWPYFMALPITAIPIAGKTLQQLVYEERALDAAPGWLLYVVVPLAAAGALAWSLALRSDERATARSFARPALLFAVWLYFGLNFAFFRFPWPWEAWTTRTPNAIVYTICAVGLTALVWKSRNERAA